MKFGLVFIAAIGATLPYAAFSQTPASTAVPTAPDISGTWYYPNYTPPLARNLPFQPWAAERFAKAQTGEDQDPGSKCYPPGVPRIMKAPYPFEIFVRPGRVDMLHEYMHMVRRIYTDGRDHPKDLDPSWMGHSIGKWEGDTFVIDTVGLNDRTWLDPAGDPHSDALHVIERIRRPTPTTLEDEITIDDPKAYTKPWSAKINYVQQKDWEIYEYICEENNKDDKSYKPSSTQQK